MSPGVLSYLRQLLPTTGTPLPDGELLHRFAVGGDEAAFTELLRRHGPLVWGVCRRVLGDAHAAEDAFQATFLQLARRAGALRRDGALSGWLHRVATRLARRAALAEQRRRLRDRTHRPATTPADELTWRELREILDMEIARLPEPYRQPLILCYLESRTQEEAARRLGLAPAVLRGRLERGRQKLRRRLEKVGLPLAAALLLVKADPIPAALGETTRRTILRVLAGGPVPPAIATLLSGGSFLSRFPIAVVALALLLGGGLGLGGATRQADPPAAPPAAEPPAQARRAGDALGDPLPPGAVRRLGTRRHRVQHWPLSWQSLPDGKSYLVHQQRGDSAEIRRIDSLSGRVLETWPIPAPSFAHHAVGFSPDGRHVLLSTRWVFYTGLRPPGQKEEQEWVLTLYDLAKRKALWENREKLEQKDWKHVDSACFSTDGTWIATTGSYGTLRLWDAATGKELWNSKRDKQTLQPLGFADGGDTLVLRGVNDNTIFLLDRAAGKQQRSFPTVRKDAQQCGLAPDGSAVLVGMYGPAVRVWDVATAKERPALDGHKQWARRFAFSPDGKTLVTGGNDPFVLVRDWPSGKVVRTIELGRSAIERMAFSGDGRRLEVLFWGEQALHFYDLTTGRQVPAASEGHKAAVYGVVLAPDGTLLSFGRDATVRNWNLATGEVVGRVSVGQDLDGGGFAVSRDGRLLAASDSGDNAVWLYERTTSKRLRKLAGGRAHSRHLIFSPDGRWLAGADPSDSLVTVWDVSNGRVVLQLKDKVTYGVDCAFSPDGGQFAATGEGVVRFWDVATWKEQPGLKAYASQGLDYSPDGRTLAAASVEGLRLFELATRRERAAIASKGGYPSRPLRLSPTGRWLAWKCRERMIHVWDIRRGEMLGSFEGHDGPITDLAFTADDRALVSASEDSTLLVWDLAEVAAKKPPPKAGDMNQAWQTLASDDAQAAYQAIRVLASSPDTAVRLLARYLQPVRAIDAERVNACLRDLDSDQFETRERATRELEQLGERAETMLERFLAGSPSLEARLRVKKILEARQREWVRQVRALEALEWIRDTGARRLMQTLAEGAPDARLTREAKATLARMRR
jgi:RNA polymerase sigma factor (sigma-70 family)